MSNTHATRTEDSKSKQRFDIICGKYIGPPEYIECDFGPDFSLKLQIPILCYSLKSDHEKHFDGLILCRVFSLLGIIHLYMVIADMHAPSGRFRLWGGIEFGVAL